jgi:photosystem II stability/assembly factor-like uncharacterized protein
MLYVSTGQQVYRSTDHGTSWQRGGDIPLGDYSATNLTVDPADPNRLYMVAGHAEGFQSADAGVTWQSWTVPNATIFGLAITNTQSTPRIWAATSAGIRFSDDRGVTWTHARSTLAENVTIDPNNPNIVYAGTQEGLLRTRDNGVSWDNIQGDANTSFIHSVAIDPANSNHVLLAGQAGIASSNDGGAHWVSSHTGIDALGVYELVASPASDRIYMHALANGIYATVPEDGSTPALDNRELRQFSGGLGSHGLGMAVIPGTPDRLFVGVGGNVARSLDGGESWSLHNVSSTRGLYQVVNASADGSRLLARTDIRLYSTSNGGDSWAEGSATGASDLHVLVSAPSNPQVIYLAGRLPGATRDAILRSADGGNTWTTHNFPGTQVFAIAVDPSDDQTLYTGGGLAEVFKSTNGGQTWAMLTIPGNYAHQGYAFWSIAVDPQNSNIVYAGGGPFIARSVDAGASWQQLTNDEARFLDIRSMVVDPLRPYSVYAATMGNSVREFSVQPDLRITADVPDIAVGHGATAMYSYRLSNAGPFDATNVRARIQLPDGAANIVASSSSASCTVAGTTVTCTAPILRTNANADITIDATHPMSGNFNVIATVDGDQPDAASADNSVTSNITVEEVTDLSVILTGSAIVARGENSTLTLRVTNAGPNEAAVASVTLELATGFSIASISPSGGTSTCVTAGSTVGCQLPQLGPGGSVSIAIVISPPSTAGSFTHMATVTSSGTDVRGANNVATAVTTVSDIAQGIDSGRNRGGGGGGSTSLFMLAALLLLSRMRAAADKFARSTRRPVF